MGDELGGRSGVHAGDILGDRYRVERRDRRRRRRHRPRRHDLALGEPRAAKLLGRAARSVPSTVERFFREARAMARLTSEHAVRVFDIGHLRRRRALPHHGAPRRPRSRRRGEAPRRAPRPRGRALRAASLRRHRPGPRERHRPPRPQAAEPLPHPPRRRLALHQGARLRLLQGAHPLGGAAPAHAQQRRPRLARVHGPGAAPLRAQRQRPLRHLVARRGALPALHRAAPLQERPGRGDGGAGDAGHAARALHRPRRPPARARRAW